MARTKRTPQTTPSGRVFFSAPEASKVLTPSKRKSVDTKNDPRNLETFSALDALDDDNSALSEMSDVSALVSSPELDLAEPEVARNKRVLTHALSTLKFTANHPDIPPWLTGLHKPLPHPDLTTLQDFEVQTRLWFDEIARLQDLRGKLPAAGDGGWYFEHFGSTVEVREVRDGVKKNVYARGVWKLVVGRQVVRQVLDEWPMTLEGELLGWGMKGETEDFLVEGEVEEDETEESVDEKGVFGSGDEAEE